MPCYSPAATPLPFLLLSHALKRCTVKIFSVKSECSSDPKLFGCRILKAWLLPHIISSPPHFYLVHSNTTGTQSCSHYFTVLPTCYLTALQQTNPAYAAPTQPIYAICLPCLREQQGLGYLLMYFLPMFLWFPEERLIYLWGLQSYCRTSGLNWWDCSCQKRGRCLALMAEAWLFKGGDLMMRVRLSHSGFDRWNFKRRAIPRLLAVFFKPSSSITSA